MSRQTPGLIKTFPADTAVGRNLIVAQSNVNAGNVMQSGAGTAGFVGVTQDEAADADNYVAVQLSGIAQVTVGASTVTAGAWVASDANGKAAPQTLHAAGGGSLTQIVGVARQTQTTGNLCDVLIQPFMGYV